MHSCPLGEKGGVISRIGNESLIGSVSWGAKFVRKFYAR